MNRYRNQFHRNLTQHLILVSLVFAIAFTPASDAAEFGRIWVDVSGTFAVDARLVEIADEKVVLLRKDGQQVAIAIDQLSVEDKEYLEGIAEPAKSENVLRTQPPLRDDIEPLPVLDLPAADHVAPEGSDLDLIPAARPRLLSDSSFELTPDPSPFRFAAVNARIPMYPIDMNDICSRPIPIITKTASGTRTTSIAMSISSRTRIPGEKSKNQVVRLDTADRKHHVALMHSDTIRLLDHHVPSGRSLMLVGFNSLAQGGELAIGTGWDAGAVKLSHRRALSDKHQVSRLPRLRWARWVDEEHLVAVIDQTLGLWNIVSGEQLYGVNGIDPRSVPAISGGRRYIAVPYDGAVHVLTTKTGKSLGRIPVDKQIPGVGFSPMGEALAIITSRRLQVWDLATGMLSSEVESRRSLGTDPPVWVDSNLVLSSSGVLLNVFRGLPVWRYDIAGTETVSVGKHVAIFRRHPTSEVSIVSIPHEAAANAMKWMDESPGKVDSKNGQVLGRSTWSASGWADRDIQISAAPVRRR